MKKCRVSLITFSILMCFLCTGFQSTLVLSQGDPPTQEQLFDGHTFSENYWNILIFNNSYWDHEDIDPMVSWLNNTWNVKWIKEGNFEMGMFAFMNKTMWNNGREVIFTTPAQMWWQHMVISGSEILIASMHSSWFGFQDDNNNGYFDASEEVSPFFYMGANTDEVRIAGIKSNPKTTASKLEKSESGSIITYSWSYLYEDIIFFVPEINRTLITPEFDWGFNYSRVDTYVSGSHHIGNVTYFEYNYRLEVDTSIGESTLYQDYEVGEIGTMVYRNESSHLWTVADYNHGWVTEDFAMCLGTWSFIWADQDWTMTTPTGTIDRNFYHTGLSEVVTTLGGLHAFDFKFSQKPNYEITNRTETISHTYPASYQTLDIYDSEFNDFVQGMVHLVGEFGRLVVGYVINQTNHFTHGIPFEDAYNSTDPQNIAAFFVTCYPEYGVYKGGGLVHDPVFKAYFNPAEKGISGFPLLFLVVSLSIGIIIMISKTRVKYLKTKT